jgi:CRISPR-associated endonuclease/helicase Cas3
LGCAGEAEESNVRDSADSFSGDVGLSWVAAFTHLTGFAPMKWQSRLYEEHLLAGLLPAAIDVPTGLGKTAIIALWLIARANGARLPRRLVYVVDRRAVVDQATEFVVNVREAIEAPEGASIKAALGLAGRALPISTLRGQHADNREWLEDPSLPAIVVGTVDMIGSRLLFEGYGVSRKMRPYHAGLLGADALVALDEAHLVPPFEWLLAAIEREPERYGAAEGANRVLIPPFRLLSLSATGRQRTGETFRLQGNAAEAPGHRGDLDDEVAAKRLQARKAVEFVEAETPKLEAEVARHALALTGNGSAPVRCVVFCDKREVAEKARNLVQSALDDAAKGKKRSSDHVAGHTELLVGARRVHERENAKAMLAALGFLAGSTFSLNRSVFLFATSAGEVGIDLDADHLVCDLVGWDRMVQRLGRVNRRGDGNARVRVVLEAVAKDATEALAKADGERSDKDREAIAKREQRAALQALFDALPPSPQGGRDASPGALRELNARARADPDLKRLIDQATTQAPLRPALTRALVEAWSMTSLEEHTGRPDVQPWIRGWVESKAETSVVWRTHLPVRRRGGNASSQEVEDFFEAAPPHVSEVLETETFRVVEWLRKRCESLFHGRDAAEEARAEAEPLGRDDVVGFGLSASYKLRDTLRVRDLLANDAKDRMQATLAAAVLVVDARVGGLGDGLLNERVDDRATTADDGASWGVAESGTPPIRFRVRCTAASQDEGDWVERYGFATERNDEGIDEQWLFVDKWRGDSANERDRALSRRPQLLREHQSWAEARARDLAERLGLGSPWTEALALAARLHDEGKAVPRWQRAFKADGGGEPYAKTRGPVNQALLDGYRHEFGSLPVAEKDGAFARLPDDLKDLVLHLIAAHHGQGRPVIDVSGCEDAPPSMLQERARQVALRFARLQKRWGPWGLAWWEALLRAADQQASRENDERRSEGN